MRILGLFNKYFLALMVIQGLVLIFIDSRSFKKACMGKTANKAKTIGVGVIVISLALYALSVYAG